MAASPARSRSPTSSRLPEEARKQMALLLSLFRGAHAYKLRSPRPSALHRARHGNGIRPTPHRGCSAPLARALRGCRAPRSFLEGIFPFQEDGSFFSEEPLPPCVTAPTIACPPSFTVTCSTRTVCSPPLRYRLSASTCAAKVRASLLKARSALSCCGMFST
jgi:hypothetical protein